MGGTILIHFLDFQALVVPDSCFSSIFQRSLWISRLSFSAIVDSEFLLILLFLLDLSLSFFPFGTQNPTVTSVLCRRLSICKSFENLPNKICFENVFKSTNKQ